MYVPNKYTSKGRQTLPFGKTQDDHFRVWIGTKVGELLKVLLEVASFGIC